MIRRRMARRRWSWSRRPVDIKKLIGKRRTTRHSATSDYTTDSGSHFGVEVLKVYDTFRELSRVRSRLPRTIV
jgi:hypothetical protein